MKVVIKEKKEKENVLTNLELINLKNVSLLQFDELKKNNTCKKKTVHGGQKGVPKNCNTYKHS